MTDLIDRKAVLELIEAIRIKSCEGMRTQLTKCTKRNKCNTCAWIHKIVRQISQLHSPSMDPVAYIRQAATDGQEAYAQSDSTQRSAFNPDKVARLQEILVLLSAFEDDEGIPYAMNIIKEAFLDEYESYSDEFKEAKG